MSTKFIVTSEDEAVRMLKAHYGKPPIAAGRCPRTHWRFWYVKGKRVVMKPSGTQTANGITQYLVTAG